MSLPDDVNIINSLADAVDDLLQHPKPDKALKEHYESRLRSARIWVKERAKMSEQPVKELPGWVKTIPCRKCKEPIFFARAGFNPKKNSARLVPISIQPVEVPDRHFNNSLAWVVFESGAARLVRNGYGKRWVIHGAICDMERPDDPYIAKVWDQNYGSYMEKREQAVDDMGKMLTALRSE